MTLRRFARAAGFAALIFTLALAPTPPWSAAQEKPPAAARNVAAEFAAAKRLLDAKDWKGAKAALEKLLSAVPGDPGVLGILPEIEEPLRVASFRAQWRGLDMKEAMGASCTKFSAASRFAEFDTHPGRQAEGWIEVGGAIVFDRPFESDVLIEFEWSLDSGDVPALLVAFDAETRNGYALGAGAASHPDLPLVVYGSGAVVRIDAGVESEIGRTKAIQLKGIAAIEPLPVRYERAASALIVKIGKNELARASDSKHRSGHVAVASSSGRMPARITVKGKLSDAWIRRASAEAEHEAFRSWSASWDRRQALPAWVFASETAAAKEFGRLPRDATADENERFAIPLMQAWDGDVRQLRTVRDVADAKSAASRAYLDGVEFLAQGRLDRAEERFRAVLASEEVFAPARIGLAASLIRAGRRDDARYHLDEAKLVLPRFPPLIELLVWEAANSGAFADARKQLSDAATAGVTSGGLRQARSFLERIEKGPQWVKRFDFETEHFQISSDHSVTACGDVGKQLEDAFASYRRHFRAAPPSGKARVYVFSGIDGYLDYASDLGTSTEGTLGVYLPRLRQLCVFLHDDRKTLWDTVRHEGFHQYLHRITDGVPIWLNEGAAEYFGFSRRKLGKTELGQAGADQRFYLGVLRKGFTPLRELFVMEQPEFMAKAEVHYVQAWSVVHFLRETKDPQFAGLLDRYLDAIVAGKRGQALFDEVLAPLCDPLSAAWRDHVDALVAGDPK